MHRTIDAKVGNRMNPDYLLGMLRYAQQHPERDASEISLATASILDDDSELLETFESDFGPADAITSLLDAWFEGE